jgi:hypothetical protein
MVFAPTHDISLGPREPAVAPRRLDRVALAARSEEGRLIWRAVIHVLDRDTVHTTWHLACCSAFLEPAAHCPEGQRLLETIADPDGHCLKGGQCGRCASAS